MLWAFTQYDLDAINEKWYREKVNERLFGSSHVLHELVAIAYAVGYNSRQIYDQLNGHKSA